MPSFECGILRLQRKSHQGNLINIIHPRVGDGAAVIEVYSNPLGYELECSGKDGITSWLRSFAPEDVALEVVA